MPGGPKRDVSIADADLYRTVRDLCLEAERRRLPRPSLDELRAAIGPVGKTRLAGTLRRLLEAGAVATRRWHCDNRHYRPTPAELQAELDRAGADRASRGAPDRPGIEADPPDPGPSSRDLYVEHMARERQIRRGDPGSGELRVAGGELKTGRHLLATRHSSLATAEEEATAMLVLSRHINEKIVISPDGEIIITLVAVNGDKVRIGIDAPIACSVHREEVYRRIVEERKAHEGPREGN